MINTDGCNPVPFVGEGPEETAEVYHAAAGFSSVRWSNTDRLRTYYYNAT
jgi:hypothetical protein